MAKSRRYRWQGFGQQAKRPAPVKRKRGAPQSPLRGKPTKAQLDYIALLCGERDRPVPTVRTKAEASAVIDALHAARRRSLTFDKGDFAS